MRNDLKKRVGEDACSFTTGFWAFVHPNLDLTGRNNRTKRTVSSMERLKDLDAVLDEESKRRQF